jgi:hypothetical protein
MILIFTLTGCLQKVIISYDSNGLIDDLSCSLKIQAAWHQYCKKTSRQTNDLRSTQGLKNGNFIKYSNTIMIECLPMAKMDRKQLCLDSLPPHSPDLNPTKRVRKLTRRLRTHNRYLPQFQQIVDSVCGQFELWHGPKVTLRRLCAIFKTLCITRIGEKPKEEGCYEKMSISIRDLFMLDPRRFFFILGGR